MKVEQLYTKCLAQGAYYISSNGEAVIIDPLRETQPYLDLLHSDNSQLKYIFETHFHADFVSGHIDLAEKTNATIVYGPTASPTFDALIAEDNQEFKVGELTIRVLHTPGHTMESSCFLLFDAEGNEIALFSGDTLFLGDVGRPDLAQKAAAMTQEELAGLLYDSLYTKILPLSDELTVYPGHGAGSACGKNMMKETVDTLGNQRKVNYALNQPNKEAFVAAVTDGLLPPPAYFGMNVAMNKKGYESFDDVKKKGLTPLDLTAFENLMNEKDILVLDARSDKEFYLGFVPKSINIGLGGDFAPWVGALIKDVNQKMVLITEPGKEEEAIVRLSRVGFDQIEGYLKGGFETWKEAGKPIDTIHRIDAETFASEVKIGESMIVDIRKEGEYAAEHVEEAYSKPLAYIDEWVKSMDTNQHFFLHCAGGYRSMIAASILKAHGISDFTEVAGGFNAIAKTSVPKTNFVCQSKVLNA